MSSPIRPAKDVNPALMYAPPRVRDQSRKPHESSPQPAEQRPRPRIGGDSDFKEKAVADTQRRPTLEPEWLPEPPQPSGRHRWWRVTLWIASLLGFTALVAWAFVLIPGASRFATEMTQPTLGSSISTDAKEPNSLAVAINRRADRLRSEVASSEEAAQQTRDQPAPREPASSALVVAQPAPVVTVPEPSPKPPVVTAAEPEPSPKPPDFVTRQIARDEVASMLRRADDFIKSGDLSAARLLLQRAAEAGDVQAALTLAGTFDPNVLKALGLRDGAPDIAKARLWYERAAKLGSADAPLRLQQLATTSAE
jgi:hypothetical protein